jgi:16S rRNA processing protein RimM
MSTEVTLAAIAGAHGITGEVRLKLFAQGVDSLARHKIFSAGDKTLTLKTIRPDKTGAVARFAEVGDRNSAEALRGTLLAVPRDSLPPLDEGEFYVTDLIGAACIDTAGVPLGTVGAVENYGASDILEIIRPDGRTFMVPITPEAVPDLGPPVVIDPAYAE